MGDFMESGGRVGRCEKEVFMHLEERYLELITYITDSPSHPSIVSYLLLLVSAWWC